MAAQQSSSINSRMSVHHQSCVHRATEFVPTGDDEQEFDRWYTIRIRLKLPCDCAYCLQQYRDDEAQETSLLAYLGYMTDADVFNLGASRARSINQYQACIRRIIYLHGDLIVKKWKKLRKNQRKDLLKQIQPSIRPEQNVLLELFVHLRDKTMFEQRTFRRAYLVQYINLETLSDDHTRLIRLLHYRSTSYPKDWVLFDNAQIQLVWHQGRIEEQRAEGCIMMTGHEYGKWKPFDHQDVHNGSAYGAPRALLILEAQELLMSFLHEFVVAILGDNVFAQDRFPGMATGTIDYTRLDESESCHEWSGLVNAEPKPDITRPWSSFGAIGNNPFAAPAKFDINAIIEIAETQTTEAQDELWLLQTEPGYFYESAKHLADCYYDKIKGLSHVHRISTTKHDNIACILTIGTFQRARDWNYLLEQCQIVKQERETYVSKPHIGTKLPKSYEQALGCLKFLLSRAWKEYQMELLKTMVKSEAFGSSYEALETGLWDNVATAVKFNIKEYHTLWDNDRIGWCLYWLTRDQEDCRTFPAISVLQYLESYLLDCHPEKSGKLDSEMRFYISNLAALERMSALLDLHRPVFKVPNSLFDINEDRQIWKVLQRLNDAPKTKTAADHSLGRICFPLNRFRLPKGIKDLKWVAETDSAHKALGTLWRRACVEFEKLLVECSVERAYIDPQLQEMRKCESPEFLSRVEEERNCIIGRLEAERERKLANISQTQRVPEFNEPTSAEVTNRKEEITLPTRSKKKTRPDVALAAEIVSKATQGERAKPEPPTIYKFKQQSITQRVVSRMFPSHDFDDSQPAGTLNWLNFVTALINLGFNRVQHSGGSAYAFQGKVWLPAMPEMRQKRSIVIHRPHPYDTMETWRLQSIGRRLNMRFGWERANFAFTK